MINMSNGRIAALWAQEREKLNASSELFAVLDVVVSEAILIRSRAGHQEESGEVCRLDCEGCQNPVEQLWTWYSLMNEEIRQVARGLNEALSRRLAP